MAAFFYPFTFIENPYVAKAIYNLICITLFSWSLYLLVRDKFKKRYEILFFLPILFFVPIRNGILFGQSYFLIFALVVFGFLSIENKKEKLGVSLISIAVLLKIFPVFYGVALFYKNWKAIFAGNEEREKYNFSHKNGITFSAQWNINGRIDERSAELKSIESIEISKKDLKQLPASIFEEPYVSSRVE